MNSEYWLVFLPKEGIVTQSAKAADAFTRRYRVKLAGNPDADAQLIEDGIKAFELDHGVKSWQDLAESYRVAML